MVLKGRTAIVTGGSSGIGRGVCVEFAHEGANVVIADLDEVPKRGIYHEQDTSTPTLEEVEKLGVNGLFVQTDVSDDEAVKHLIEATAGEFGGVDIVVNNAGIFTLGDSQELPVSEWDRIIGINLKGVFLTTRYSLPYMRKSKTGRIINIASVHAFAGGGGPAYAPAKAGVVNLTRDTAVEVADDNITVNAVCPGYIETAIQDYLTSEQIDQCLHQTPLPRLGLPRDIGRACVFFASDDAAWITGTALPVDGGWLAPIS